MDERLRPVAATLVMDSGVGHGARVEARVPLQEVTDEKATSPVGR